MNIRARVGCKIIDVDIEVNEQHGTVRIEDMILTAENAELLAIVLNTAAFDIATYEGLQKDIRTHEE